MPILQRLGLYGFKNSHFCPQLFPNPVQDQLYVCNQLRRIEGASLQVFDLKGQLLTQRQNIVLGEGTDAAQALNVSQLTAGMYVLRIQTADGQHQVLKFMKH